MQKHFSKGYTSNWSKEDCMIKKVKDTMPRTLLVILTMKKLLEHLMKKNCKRKIKQSLEFKKSSKEKLLSCMLNWKPW